MVHVVMTTYLTQFFQSQILYWLTGRLKKSRFVVLRFTLLNSWEIWFYTKSKKIIRTFRRNMWTQFCWITSCGIIVDDLRMIWNIYRSTRQSASTIESFLFHPWNKIYFFAMRTNVFYVLLEREAESILGVFLIFEKQRKLEITR